MRKAVRLLIVAIFLFGLIATPTAKSGTMPSGAVMTKFFNVTSIPTPQQINYFNKVFSLGNNLSGKMVAGSDGSSLLAVFQIGSGKRDIYKWTGSVWQYWYSIDHIVPGFEEPVTLNSYKYASWSEYAIHAIDVASSDLADTGLLVMLTGPTTGTVQQGGGTGTRARPVKVLTSVTVKNVDSKGNVTGSYTVKPGDPAWGWISQCPNAKETFADGSYIEHQGNYEYDDVGGMDLDYISEEPFRATYTVSVSGGKMPYVVYWSQDGLVSSSGMSATYEWTTAGTKTVEVTVRDATGKTVTKTLTVTLN